MKPLDPRLLRYARGARTVLGVGGLFGVLRTLAIITWCWCIAQSLAVLVLPVLDGKGGAAGQISDHAYSADMLPWLVIVAVLALIVRSASSWAMDALAARGAVQVKAQLRAAALDAIDQRSPEALATRSDASGATVLGRGLDALDGYFSGYLPQLILTMCATPLLVLAVFLADPVSGLVVVIVFPVIPVFMILIGLATKGVQQKQWDQLQHLSRSFLDVVEGLSTLKIFRREDRQVNRIRRETGEYRSRTMQVLRVTFLSGFVLDLAGTFSIALVAVTVGTRLVTGEFSLALGLFVLLLLPEAFIPIRAVGTAFHASTEGLAAAEQVFELIEAEPAEAADSAAADAKNGTAQPVQSVPVSAGIVFDEVQLRRGPHTVGPMSFEVQSGEVVALVGPSGSGKSSLVASLLGFISPAQGMVSRPVDVSWAGQRPGLLQGTVAENVALGDSSIDDALVARALETVGLENILADYSLGAQGAGLSGGQAQRVAIARALYRGWRTDAGALVFDEPSSALDTASEMRIAEVLKAEAASGRAVLLISHRAALIDSADRVVNIGVPA
ncbi:thiol reductant ABC exporter subunit CydD [Leucobacter sp. UT-8R-CII-1-4]|uniref:thiol reductant ABC exporter subunit CydD n=1 Tax=Leucobacter sp. UT-8R-CII-1-4 TaxID=3040075 RepID=UPI0024A82D49|nr:thiol reductant ABC exporter subunit CydD [Leucobacter sp. UT-8R-CII-1-4]MDI6024552.1 thiol reductant ABC exporter subunit CydD [Leucobacter sp. UT-8R-CII-1-4]